MASSESRKNERYELFINGYIRETDAYLHSHVPKALKVLILTFYPKLIHYDGIFIKENCSNGIKILSKHQITGYGTTKLDKPLPVELNESMINDMIYEWKLHTSNDGFDRNSWYCIGVGSNRYTDLSMSINSHIYGDVNAFGITLLDNKVYVGLSTPKNNEETYEKVLQTNQIIIAQYSVLGKQCKLQIFVEELDKTKTLVYSMQLPNDNEIESWYPVFSKPKNSTKITLIPFRSDD